MHLDHETYLRLYKNQINEQNHKIMLDVFVGEAFASWTLRETDAFSQRLVVGFAVSGVEIGNRVAALDADGHPSMGKVKLIEESGVLDVNV
jgi:hypothetical protein